MKSDAFFVKGQSHDICQDYAVARGDVIAVSDGCSLINNNGKCYKHPHSDVAARIVACGAVQPECDASIPVYNEIRLLLDIEMDATLLKIRVEGIEVYLTTIGDGVIYMHHKNGEHRIIVISYEPNTPTYMSYLLEEKKTAMFLKNAPIVTNMIYVYDKDWNLIDTSKVQEPVSLAETTITFDNAKMEADIISLFSDGITDIYTPTGKLPVKDAVRVLVSYKRTNGEFVLARMKAQLREWASQGIYPNDDLSMATLIL
jgi:hypothetical protein